MKKFGARFLFAILSATIMVFFSEKTYWHIQGYVLFELILFYFFPASVFLWAVQRFHVHRVAPLFLCAAVYGFLAEGVITTLLYEKGLWDWFHVSYTSLAWHAPLSVVFGWYYLRKLLLHGSLTRLVTWCAAFGVFWGCWSLVYWVPENPGEGVLGDWPVPSFAIYVFTFTLILCACHWLLGQGIWMSEFKPSAPEKWFVGLIILAYFAFVTVPQAWIALIKLPVLLGITFLALWSNLKKERGAHIFEELRGPVSASRVLALLCMPAAATTIYGLAAAIQPTEDLIRSIFLLGIVAITGYAGGILFLAAVFLCFRSKPQEKRLHVA